MPRMTTMLSAVAVLAASCGGSTNSADDVLAELDLTTAELACYEAGYAARGFDMNSILASDPDELSLGARQAVLDIAADCDGVERFDDTAAPATTTEPPADTADDAARTYDELEFLEQAFVDGITESGGSVEVGICILEEFRAAGIEIFDLAGLATDDPPPEVLAAIFACGEELLESGLFGGFGDFGAPETDDGSTDRSAIDTYGDDAELDQLWDSCADGDLAACDQLWLDSPFGSGYEAFGNSCGEREERERFGNCDTTEPMFYGESDVLDSLWDACEGGDFAACDLLWRDSPIGSDYEAYGSTCGARLETEQFGRCEAELG